MLSDYLKDDSIFTGHPSSRNVPGVEASTGSLGHGLSIGVGMALAGKLDRLPYRTYVLMSDGECDEGAVWEAVLAAGNWGLSHLTCIVDDNEIQGFGRTKEIQNLEPFAQKWQAFRWNTQVIDGHDHEAICEALGRAKAEETKPSVIIAHTIKGKGVSFMEDTVDWHYRSLSKELYEQALSELPS